MPYIHPVFKTFLDYHLWCKCLQTAQQRWTMPSISSRYCENAGLSLDINIFASLGLSLSIGIYFFNPESKSQYRFFSIYISLSTNLFDVVKVSVSVSISWDFLVSGSLSKIVNFKSQSQYRNSWIPSLRLNINIETPPPQVSNLKIWYRLSLQHNPPGQESITCHLIQRLLIRFPSEVIWYTPLMEIDL